MSAVASDVRERSRRMLTATYPQAERALTEWGLACGRAEEEHGVARSAGLRAIIEHVQRSERLRKASKKQRDKMREADARRLECTACGFRANVWLWHDGYCPQCGAEGLTARGTETVSPIALFAQSLSSRVLRVDAIVKRMPGDLQAPIIRRFAWRQADWRAAEELGLYDEALYRGRVRAGICWVAYRLPAEVQSRRPM